MTGASPPLRDGPPSSPRTGTPALTASTAWELSLRLVTSTSDQHQLGEEFPSSVPKPRPSSRHLNAGHHRSRKNRTPLRLIPGPMAFPGSDVIYTVSTRPQWFTHVRLLDPHLPHPVRLFRNAHHPGSFTNTAHGGVRPPPAGRPRRTYLHLRYSTKITKSSSYIRTSQPC